MSFNIPRESTRRIRQFLEEMLLNSLHISLAEDDSVSTPTNDPDFQSINMPLNPSSQDQSAASPNSEPWNSRENVQPESENLNSNSPQREDTENQDEIERFVRIQWLLLQPLSGLSEDTQNSGLSINIFHIYGGLRDSVISELINQIDCNGVPPAEKDKIDSLPKVKITQQQVDNSLQCSICLSEFILEEQVKQLYCTHQYHCSCIDTWLSQHGNCPICRENLTVREPTTKASSSSESVDLG
ncbi:E3 ubiquitin-protein ligase RNF115-like [Octopus vulgaris]|nr:E3 ubiquitin-protein ligase RNF126 isoform X1 [Octopus sinensis]CAI9729277.1 E3 ubiquitin-protein ligase RNF115-like [Octopus vulgaris]